MSHGSIVAREYGIPAVVNIPGVMKITKDNQLVTVDLGYTINRFTYLVTPFVSILLNYYITVLPTILLIT